MQPLVRDKVARFVSLSVTIISTAKMAEPIKIPCGMWTKVGSTNHVLDGSPDPLLQMGSFEGGRGCTL